MKAPWRSATCVIAVLIATKFSPVSAEERRPMKVAIYESTLAGASQTHAIAHIRPMIDLLSRQVGYPIDCEIRKGETADALFQFGKEIDKGDCHVGVMWGLEYGWLRGRYPKLQPQVLVTPGGGVPLRCDILVRENSPANSIADLRNSTLAICERAPLMERLYLAAELAKDHRTIREYFSEVRTYGSVEYAIGAVLRGEAGCVVVNAASYGQFTELHPTLALRSIASSAPFPMVAIVGRRDLVNDLREGLWNDSAGRLEYIHQTAEGQQCLTFWRIAQFVRITSRPEDEFEKLVRGRVKDYPVTVLENLWKPPKPIEDSLQ